MGLSHCVKEQGVFKKKRTENKEREEKNPMSASPTHLYQLNCVQHVRDAPVGGEIVLIPQDARDLGEQGMGGWGLKSQSSIQSQSQRVRTQSQRQRVVGPSCGPLTLALMQYSATHMMGRGEACGARGSPTCGIHLRRGFQRSCFLWACCLPVCAACPIPTCPIFATCPCCYMPLLTEAISASSTRSTCAQDGRSAETVASTENTERGFR